jgi:hypothetical protein
MEVGYLSGWSSYHNLPAYMTYTGWKLNGAYGEQILSYTVPDGTSREFFIYNTPGTGTWTASINYGPEGYVPYSKALSFTWANRATAGGEFFNNHPSAQADTFTITNLHIYRGPVYGWIDMDSMPGPGCNTWNYQNPTRTGDECLVSPGFNGVPPNWTSWYWNKPL